MNRFFMLLICTLGFLIYSCNTGVDYSIRVLTNIEQTTLWAELFMAEHPMEKVELVFEDDISLYLSQHNDIDLVITDTTLEHSYFLPYPNKNNRIADGKRFYSGILKMPGNSDGIKFFPISFDLPIFVAKKDSFTDYSDGILIDIKSAKKMAAEKTMIKNNKLKDPVFFPVFSDDFIMDSLHLFKVNFVKANNNKIIWDNRELEAFTDFIADWYIASKTDYTIAKNYGDKYLRLPQEQCILQDRTGMMYMRLSDFFSIREESREKLDFKFLSGDSIVPATGRLVYAAVPVRSKKQDISELFLNWLFDQDTQKRIIEYTKEQGLPFFGMAGGLSSITEISEAVFPIAYRELAGKIPESEHIMFSPPQEEDIKKFIEKKLLPWLDEILAKKSNRPLE
ncbi:hypothetical protein WKV44_02445 [Spirochaetia bacterium 38H-sp]|uniref:Carbohydrate ABC transporter substrate-binding protein n=1 Tax=Rarispira pelagica TaxID=3141764 RepID=A0ABU9U9Q9_9SPIR